MKSLNNGEEVLLCISSSNPSACSLLRSFSFYFASVPVQKTSLLLLWLHAAQAAEAAEAAAPAPVAAADGRPTEQL